MTSVSYSLPWGAVYVYQNSTVPRLGEHVSLSDQVFVACEVRHFPATNSAWVGLKVAE